MREKDIFIHNYLFQNDLSIKLEEDIRTCGDQQNKSTNVKALMTHWNMFDYSEAFGYFADWILERFIESNLFTFKEKIECRLSSLWGMIYHKGDYCKLHDHLPIESFKWRHNRKKLKNEYFSFVYFLKVDKTSSPLIFETGNIHVKPEIGKLVIFPSHFLHYVPKQSGITERITISGNIIVDI